MDSNSLKQAYSKLSNEELFSIIENKQNFTPLASQVADEEIKNRQISDDEILSIKLNMLSKQLEIEEQKIKKKAVETKIKTYLVSFITSINPIQKDKPIADRLIAFAVIIISCLLLFELKTCIKLIYYCFEYRYFDIVILVQLITTIISFFVLYQFWKRKKIGWLLLSIYFLFMISYTLWGFIPSSKFNYFFSKQSILEMNLRTIFYGGIAYVLYREDVRAEFRIEKDNIILSIIIGLCICIGFYLLV